MTAQPASRTRNTSPLPHHARSRRFGWRTATCLTLAAIVLFGFLRIGHFLAAEDPLMQADAIFVFAGTRIERPLEAADLYREGYAPRVVITRAVGEPGAEVVERRGVRIPSDFDVNKDLLLKLGVPVSALIGPRRVHDNTGQEAETLRDLAMRNHWNRVIVVSSKYHLRRAGLAVRRAMADTGIDVRMRGSRYDDANPGRWWSHRSDIRWILSETPKLIVYAVGLG